MDPRMKRFTAQSNWGKTAHPAPRTSQRPREEDTLGQSKIF